MDLKTCSLLTFALQLLFQLAAAQLVRNRSVQCNSGEMTVSLEFVQPFFGVIYTNKFYQHKACKFEGNASRQMKFSIPLTVQSNSELFCGVEIKPSSSEFTTTLIISPMKGLLVEGMEGLTVRCLYHVGDVTLTLPVGTNGPGILISHQTEAGIVTGSGGNPFLQMAIRDGHGISGEVTQSAQVGQRITLDVVMRDTTVYDFYVHDCYAHDGSNAPEATVSVIDENGCAVRLSRAVDVPVFTTAPVPNGVKHVYVHMYGFQFTTSQLVYFECQVRPCLQNCNRAQCVNGGPSPNNTRPSRDTSSFARNNKIETNLIEHLVDNYNLTTVIRIEPQELVSVVQAARDGEEYGANGSDMCISVHVGVTILVVFFIICIISLSTAIVLCVRVYRVSKNEGDNSDSSNCYSPSTTQYGGQFSISSQPPRPLIRQETDFKKPST